METNKFLPYGRQTIDDQDIAAVVAVLKGDYLTQGPAIQLFEEELAKSIGCKHVVVVNSGTAALHLAYASLNLKPQEAVIVPAITFAATANAAVYCEATPVFADVDPRTGLITKETCETAIRLARAMGLTPRLIVPVHYAGLPAPMKDICDIAAHYECQVFEDACHALGASYRLSADDDWQKVGNLHGQSLGAAFSFHPVKHIASGEGGAIATNNDRLADLARTLRTHGITRNPEMYVGEKAFEQKTGKTPPWYYEMISLGWNYRMPDILAALGASQAKKLDSIVEKRREIAQWYFDDFKDVAELQLPHRDNLLARHSWHLFPVLLNQPGINRIEMMDFLKKNGIGTQVHYLPVPYMPYYQKNFDHQNANSLEHAWAFYEKELSLPMYPDLNRANVSYVSSRVLEFLRQ